MKKPLLLSFAFIAMATSQTYAQWNLAQKPGSHEIFHDMDFFKSNTGVIVGVNYDDDSPVLYRSTDKGQHWTKISNAQYPLQSVSCVNTTLAYASYGSFLAKSVDAGLTWTSVPYTTEIDLPNDKAELNKIRFTDENNGLATSSERLIRTNNKGTYWKLIYTYPQTEVLHYFSKDNKNISLAINNWYIHSTDSGATWDSTNIQTALQGKSPLDVYFISPDKGFITTTNGYVLKTNDAGQNWTLMEVDTTEHLDLYQISFVDSLNGFVTGVSYTTWATNDGGDTWRDVYVSNGDFFAYDLERTYFFNMNEGCSKASGGLIDRVFYNNNLQKNKTGLAENTGANSFEVFPNPVIDELFIQSNNFRDPVKLSIIDITGREVLFQDNASLNKRIDLSTLEKGVYTILLTQGSIRNEQRKIVKM